MERTSSPSAVELYAARNTLEAAVRVRTYSRLHGLVEGDLRLIGRNMMNDTEGVAYAVPLTETLYTYETSTGRVRHHGLLYPLVSQ